MEVGLMCEEVTDPIGPIVANLMVLALITYYIASIIYLDKKWAKSTERLKAVKKRCAQRRRAVMESLKADRDDA